MNKHHEKNIVLFGLPSLLVGGIENHLVRQLNVFDTQKYEFHLVTLYDYGDRQSLYSALPDHVVIHRLNFKGRFDVASIWNLYRLLGSVNPSIVVSSMFSANTIFRLLKPLVGYKIITREHNIYVE